MMTAEVLKRCSGCGLEYPLIFFRRNRRTVPHASGTEERHPKCLRCEQDAVDGRKRGNRWPAKARATIKLHARKWRLSPEAFIEKYGWDIPRIAHILKHASENTCSYCREPYDTMGHGPADVTIDIIDPRREPFIEFNVQPCCATCNRRKGNKTPEEWAVILRCWRQADRQSRLIEKEPMVWSPLWQAINPELPQCRH